MKTFCLLLLLAILYLPHTGFAQTKETAIPMLALKNKPYFKETDWFEKQKDTLIFQLEISKDVPDMVDEEYAHVLTLKIWPSDSLLKQEEISLSDSTKVICIYNRPSVWNWDKEQTNISGNVKFISLSRRKMELRLSITVMDLRRNGSLIYEGSRIFYKSPGSNNRLKKPKMLY